ncbi:MAG TPA: hypothetical protein VGM18_05680 [Candidatus Sulfotelmatobacter sp.]
MRQSAPAAVIAVVLALTLQLIYKRPNPIRRSSARSTPSEMVPSPKLPAANITNAIELQSSIVKPPAGKAMLAAATASVSSNPVGPAQTSAQTQPRKVRTAPTQADDVGNDVTVRTFVDRYPDGRLTKRSGQRTRISHIGDDVTVRYFAPSGTVTR